MIENQLEETKNLGNIIPRALRNRKEERKKKGIRGKAIGSNPQKKATTLPQR